MEYNNVTFTAYLSAAIVAALLTTTYCYQFFRGQRTWLFAPAAALHTLNLSLIALSFVNYQLSSLWLLFVECLHFNAWVLAMALTLKTGTLQQTLPRSLKILFGAGWPITGVVLFAAVFDHEGLLYLSAWLPLMLAVIALVSV